jgi:hypothetical protein
VLEDQAAYIHPRAVGHVSASRDGTPHHSLEHRSARQQHHRPALMLVRGPGCEIGQRYFAAAHRQPFRKRIGCIPMQYIANQWQEHMRMSGVRRARPSLSLL